jgi:hypothetical protein
MPPSGAWHPVQLPQWSTVVGSTHAPLQASGSLAPHIEVHVPLSHSAVLPSGAEHACPHPPQLAGSVGSTHPPSHSIIEPEHLPASVSASFRASPWLGPVSLSIDESTPGPIGLSMLASMPLMHVKLSEHVPDVSVPQPATPTTSVSPQSATPVSPAQSPSVTA